MNGTPIVFAAWGFGSFVYFKIAFQLFFGRGTIISAALLGVMIAILVYAFSYQYAVKAGAAFARSRLSYEPKFIGSTFLIFLAALAICIIAGKLVIFGFDSRLNREFGYDFWYSFQGTFKRRMPSRTEDSYLLILILSVPIILHYAMIIYSVISQIKLNLYVSNEDTEPDNT